MSLAGSSETMSGGGTGATSTVGGKEHPVVMVAGSDGHIIGSRPDFLLYFTPATNAVGRILGDLFNTTTTKVRVRGIWLQPTFTAITGAAIEWGIQRTSAIGSGGAALTPIPMDTSAGAWLAGATARSNPTAGATLAAEYFRFIHLNEETNAAFGMVPLVNLLPQLGDRVSEIVLNQNEGLAVRQISGATVGLTGMMLLATFDN